jgi:hypothetical protein
MIVNFVINKMSGYIAGGMKPETAAHFTRMELSAIYEGNRHSRDGTGQWRITPPPEALDIKVAIIKCEAIIENLKICAKKTEKGQPFNAGTETQDKSGFEKIAEYAGMKTA